jgi:hypothetical protein
LYRKDPKKKSMRRKVNIPRDTSLQKRKDIRDIKAKKKNIVTTVVTARKLDTKVNSRTRNKNNKITTDIIKFPHLRHILVSELDTPYAEQISNTAVRLLLDSI